MDGLNFRKHFGIQNLKKQVLTPDHGPCCVCQKCGYEYDECKCQDNALVEMAEYVELLESEIGKATTLPGMGDTSQDKTCDGRKGNYEDNPLLALYDEVIQECSIKDEVGDYFGIQQVGLTQIWRCVCPFHQDHKPSMELNVKSEKFKCLSCGESGDIVDFAMRFKGVSEKDALIYLAVKAGIEPDNFLKS